LCVRERYRRLESQNQSVDGQNFTFALSTPGYAANTASTMTLRVQGDFNGEAGEFVTVFIEGLNFGTFGLASGEAYDSRLSNLNEPLQCGSVQPRLCAGWRGYQWLPGRWRYRRDNRLQLRRHR